jgi:hypothetical protein
MILRFMFAALLVFPQTRLLAHHSLAAEFDGSKPVILHGTVTKVAWTNPHVFLWVDVPGGGRTLTNWTVESAAPIYLERLGWFKQSLKVGDSVTIRAYPAKDQPNMAKTDAVDLPDGRRVTTGRADDAARDSTSR